jgi:hypothetical protein
VITAVEEIKGLFLDSVGKDNLMEPLSVKIIPTGDE